MAEAENTRSREGTPAEPTLENILDVVKARVEELYPGSPIEQRADVTRRIALRLSSRRDAMSGRELPLAAELERAMAMTVLRHADGRRVDRDPDEIAADVAQSEADLSMESEDCPPRQFTWGPIGDMDEELAAAERDGDEARASFLRTQIRAGTKSLDGFRRDPNAQEVGRAIAAGEPFPAGSRMGTPVECANKCLEFALDVAARSTDPSKRDAVEAIRLALRAMFGEREGLQVDALTRLRAIILKGTPAQSDAADMRTLVDLIERRAAWVTDAHGVANEAGPLRADIRRALTPTFSCLTEAQCAEALSGLFREHGSGRRTAVGAAADLAAAVGAWGFDAGNREDAVRAIDKAVSRGNPDA